MAHRGTDSESCLLYEYMCNWQINILRKNFDYASPLVKSRSCKKVIDEKLIDCSSIN